MDSSTNTPTNNAAAAAVRVAARMQLTLGAAIVAQISLAERCLR